MAREREGGLGFLDRGILLIAWLVTCGLVYLLGFYVGRGVPEEPLGPGERVVRLPVTSAPPPEGQRPKAETEITAYEMLAAGRHDSPADLAPATPAAPARPAPAREETPPPREEPPPARELPPAARSEPPAIRNEPPAVRSEPRPEAPPARPLAAARPDEAPARPAAPPATTPSAPAGGSAPPISAAATPAPARPTGNAWTVLARPTRDRAEAEDLQQNLRARGYDATLVRVARDGDTWYRVQVGRYPTSEQASAVMHRLRDREGVPHVFVAAE